MTQPPTPDSDRRDPLGFDELLALLLAFSAVGTILWWSIGRRAESWITQAGGSARQAQVETAPVVPVVPSPTAAALPDPAGAAVLPTVSPSVSPQAVTGVARTAVIAGVVAPAVVASPGASAVAPAVIPTVTPTVTPSVSQTGQRPVIVIPSAAAPAAVFSDVPNNYWAYPFIAALSQRGLITGLNDGTFRPDEPVNRAQYAALLSGVLNNGQQSQIPFNDVPAGYWGNQAIDEAVRSDFLKGYPDQSFQPEQPITKLQVLLSLANGFDLPQPADPNQPLQALTNRDQVPAWARPAVGAAVQSDVVVSYPDVKQFQPNQPATRAEVAAMLYQALKTKGNLPPIQSNYILQP